MRVGFQPVRTFAPLDDEELKGLVTKLAPFPEVLVELYWEICERRFADWQTWLGVVEERFISARHTELKDEIDALHARRDARALSESLEHLERYRRQGDRPPPGERTRPDVVPRAPAVSTSPLAAGAPAPAAPRPVIGAPTMAEIRNWHDAASLVRHATVSPNAKLLEHKSLSSEEWAKYSPLALLGYSVGLSGMSDLRREQFLADFVSKARLPATLPRDYLNEWGEPGSRERLLRTCRHIAFQRILREKNDPIRYQRAIDCWNLDLDFLQRAFNDVLSRHEWERARRDAK